MALGRVGEAVVSGLAAREKVCAAARGGTRAVFPVPWQTPRSPAREPANFDIRPPHREHFCRCKSARRQRVPDVRGRSMPNASTGTGVARLLGLPEASIEEDEEANGYQEPVIDKRRLISVEHHAAEGPRTSGKEMGVALGACPLTAECGPLSPGLLGGLIRRAAHEIAAEARWRAFWRLVRFSDFFPCQPGRLLLGSGKLKNPAF